MENPYKLAKGILQVTKNKEWTEKNNFGSVQNTDSAAILQATGFTSIDLYGTSISTDGVRVEFDTESVGENKSIIFSGEYTLSGEDASNYKLIQPSGITASIRPYIADGNEYSTSSSDWLRSDFIITAKEEWQLSYTNTADGNWVDTLTVSKMNLHVHLWRLSGLILKIPMSAWGNIIKTERMASRKVHGCSNIKVCII